MDINNLPQFYLRSSIDDWKCLEKRKFVRKLSDEDEMHYVFVVEDVEVPAGLTEFKIASEDWNVVNLGSSPYVHNYLLEERVVRTLTAGSLFNVKMFLKWPLTASFVLHISKNNRDVCFIMWKHMEDKLSDIDISQADAEESARLSKEALEPLVRELSKSWRTLLKEKLRSAFSGFGSQQTTEPIIIKELILNEEEI